VELGSGRTRIHVGGQCKYQKGKGRIAAVIIVRKRESTYCAGYLEYNLATCRFSFLAECAEVLSKWVIFSSNRKWSKNTLTGPRSRSSN
jgi:hypothetical protein